MSNVSIQTVELNFLVIENTSDFWNRDESSSCTLQTMRFKDVASFQGFHTANLLNVDFSDVNIDGAVEIKYLREVRISSRLRSSHQFDPIAAISCKTIRTNVRQRSTTCTRI